MNPLDDSEETICAIATPNGVGSIGVIRVSGLQAFPIVQKIFRGKKPVGDFKSHTVHAGTIIDPETGNPVDEVLLVVMCGPRSYTREDVVEIQAHGNPHLLQRILSGLTMSGARLARPGEFTRRAFLSGRMDLSQAEAVMELIVAQSRAAEALALQQLRGDLSSAVCTMRENLVSLLSQIEASIDFTEQGIEVSPREAMITGISDCKQSVDQLLAGYETGKQIREGSVVVLTGRPNSGKSSILNRLLGEDRAIVTPIPGTTRDTLSEAISLNGHLIQLVDTAGFHETTDPIEWEGMRRSEAALEKADLALFVLDATLPLGVEEEILEKRIADKKKIVVINKSDLPRRINIEEVRARYPRDPFVYCSAKTGEAFHALREHLVDCLIPPMDTERHPRVSLLRQKNHLMAASRGLEQALCAAHENASMEFIAADLRMALGALGEIVGAVTNDAILDQIFSRFCIGK